MLQQADALEAQGREMIQTAQAMRARYEAVTEKKGVRCGPWLCMVNMSTLTR